MSSQVEDTVSNCRICSTYKHTIPRNDIPDVLITDNGPQFDSEEFRTLVKDYNVQDIAISSHPQSNAMTERSVQTVKSLLKRLLMIIKIHTSAY